MQKIEIGLDELREKIQEFYDEKLWRFITLNAVLLDEKSIELQWIFSKYEALDEIIVYFCKIEQTQVVPSIEDIIPSAIISQREIVDLFGVEIEGSEKGLYLDEDSVSMPLANCSVGGAK